MSPHDDTLIDVSQIAPIHLELESARAHDLVGPYGAFVATMAPAPPSPTYWDAPRGGGAGWSSTAPGPTTTTVGTAPLLDTLAVLPVGLWKRLALYGSLFGLFGNLLRCGGLSTSTNVACAVIVVLGVAGILACAQRNP